MTHQVMEQYGHREVLSGDIGTVFNVKTTTQLFTKDFPTTLAYNTITDE